MRRLILITIFVLTNSYLWCQVWKKYDINALTNIAVDNQGNKWFSTYDGVYRFDNTDWTKFDITNGLATNSITSILIDKSNNKWFGSFTTDNIDTTFVTKYDGLHWTKYNVTDSSKNEGHSAIWDIKQDTSGNIWFATTSGVSMFDGLNWTYFHIKDGLPSEYIRCIVFDNFGNKWFGTQNGLSKFDGISWTTYNTPDLSGNSGNCILSLAFDNQNKLWVGGAYGLYKLENSKIVNANYSINTSVNAIAFDKNGGMWLGISNGFISKGELRITSANEGIKTIAVDTNNDIWLGTYSWAVKYVDTPLIFNVYPDIVELDTLNGSKNYFVINSNTDWTLNDNDSFEERWLSYNKHKGSDIDTIWVTATEDYHGFSRSSQIYVSEFGLTTRTVTVRRGRTSGVLNLQNSNVKIYPNPVIDNLVIESASQNNIDKLEIYSINGSFLSLIESPKTIINMSSYNEGVYYLKIYCNNSIVTKKIIKMDK
jgi:ligand-binding sensor domain-containing protein